MRVTIDTGAVNSRAIAALAKAKGWDLCVISASNRETEGSPYHADSRQHAVRLEVAVADESRLDESVWASEEDAICFEETLRIIGAGSFPPVGQRHHLSPGQRNQLRDAQIFCSHVHDARDLFITTDRKAFINGGRREALERRFNTQILTPDECLTEFGQPVA